MRKSFDSLHALVREHLELDGFAGHLFVFASRRKDRVKILYWDRDGFAIWAKRLEEGTYAMPSARDHNPGVSRLAEWNRSAAGFAS
jgi:transposase